MSVDDIVVVVFVVGLACFTLFLVSSCQIINDVLE